MYFDPILMIIAVVFMLLGLFISSRLKSKFAKYSQSRLSSGMSGKEIAEKMLKDNGIYDVKVTSVGGMLTDHYNPLNKTVNLSHDVYNGRNAAATAVAAHECGHLAGIQPRATTEGDDAIVRTGAIRLEPGVHIGGHRIAAHIGEQFGRGQRCQRAADHG